MLYYPTVNRQINKCYAAATDFVKCAAAGKRVTWALSGMLQARTYKGEDWLILSVPNAIVRGIFDAMDVPGIELPGQKDGGLFAHITVMRPNELRTVGGAEALRQERGKMFNYGLGSLIELELPGGSEFDRCWYVRVHSTDLQNIRRSYGLPSLPDDEKDFHITVAYRRRGVLGRNVKTKGPEHVNEPPGGPI